MTQAEERAAPPAAVQVLRQILAYRPERMDRAQTAIGPARLLPEWLSLARRAGVAVPPELLPEMLELGRRNAEMCDEVAAAAGALGQWLAAINPPWRYAAALPADPAAAWEAGTAEERLRIFRQLRRTDPAAALGLLRSTWAAETRDDRVAFLDAMQTGLSLDDEPFLESVLDEPVVEPGPEDGPRVISDWLPPPREVRTTAVDLLAMLPGSRLVTRMFARLAPLLTLHEPPGERARIELRRPAGDGEEFRRYGIGPWMESMLAVVPPSLWSARWGRGPTELLQAARDIGDDDVVIRAWTDAALRVRDAEYAEARLRMPGGRHPSAGIQAVAEVIPPERLEPLALERLSAHGLAFRGTVPELLWAARFPWSPALTRAVLEALPATFPTESHNVDYTVDAAAPYMHPATAIATLREQGDPHEGPWVDLLHLRATLHQGFA